MTASPRAFSAAYEAANASPPRPRATPADAFRAATTTWLRGQRIDMGALAASLGVSRPTLYKWCGGREQLLTDVLWSLTETIFDLAVASTGRLRGTKRVLAVAAKFMGQVTESPAMHAYVRNETHAAIRLITTRGGLQDRLVDKIAAFLLAETERSDLRLNADPHLVAYAIVRVSEGFLYNDTIAAVEPRLDDAVEIIQLIVT